MKKSERQLQLFTFVHISHFTQKRKYTSEPYSVHLIAVAEMAESYGLNFGYEIGLCHDLLEDTSVTDKVLLYELVSIGYEKLEALKIVNGVIELTDVFTAENYPNLNRAKRKELECERMATISENSQSIKYCDLIDNTKSILEHDANFSKVYLKEKRDLLKVMNKGDKHLFYKALGQV